MVLLIPFVVAEYDNCEVYGICEPVKQNVNITTIGSDDNSTGLILNWSNIISGSNLNDSGYIIDWNWTGYIKDWVQDIVTHEHDQFLNTTSGPTFANLTTNGNVTINGDLSVDKVVAVDGNAKIVSTGGAGALSIQDNVAGTGGTIDFGGNTASLGISRDGVQGTYDWDGTFVIKQKGSNPDGDIEFAIIEEGGDIRLAIPKSAPDNALGNPRSMIIGYGAENNASDIKCSHQGFSSIDCDTGGTGGDLGVTDDIQALGTIYTNENVTATKQLVGESISLTGINANITGWLNGDNGCGGQQDWTIHFENGTITCGALISSFPTGINATGAQSHFGNKTIIGDDANMVKLVIKKIGANLWPHLEYYGRNGASQGVGFHEGAMRIIPREGTDNSQISFYNQSGADYGVFGSSFNILMDASNGYAIIRMLSEGQGEYIRFGDEVRFPTGIKIKLDVENTDNNTIVSSSPERIDINVAFNGTTRFHNILYNGSLGTFTKVYSGINVFDKFKKGDELLKADSKINHSAFDEDLQWEMPVYEAVYGDECYENPDLNNDTEYCEQVQTGWTETGQTETAIKVDQERAYFHEAFAQMNDFIQMVCQHPDFITNKWCADYSTGISYG